MNRGGIFHFYHADGLGSIAALTNPSGTTVRSYTYDSFGQIVAETGTVTNPYTYTAREFDPETGLLYLRNRHYDPTIGRFVLEDKLNFGSVMGTPLKRINKGIILHGLLRTPGFQHRYLYANGNPIGRVDPLGLWYIDTNVTVGYWLGFTGGIMVNDEGIYPYIGGGLVTPGVSPSVTYSSYDPATGWNIGLQGGYWGGGQAGYSFSEGGGGGFY
jgi:RHS repeat-associated protein